MAPTRESVWSFKPEKKLRDAETVLSQSQGYLSVPASWSSTPRLTTELKGQTMQARRRLQITRPLRSKRLPAVASLGALALLVGACGADTSETAADDGLFRVETTQVVLGSSASDSDVTGNDSAAADTADEDSASDDGGEAVPADEQAAYDAYFDCMNDEGIDMAALETSGSSGDQAELDAVTSSDDFLAASRECEYLLAGVVGSFDVAPEQEALLSDRSADLAACGREVLGVDIPDDILLLDEDDPRLLELEALETTPEQDTAIEACFEEHLGDVIDDDGELVNPADEGGE